MAEAIDPDDKLLELTGTVAAGAAALGIPSALIGALALAVHGYVRATGTRTWASARCSPLRFSLSGIGSSTSVT